MQINNFSWKIGGEAGYGILSAGAMFARAMLRAGLNLFDYTEYPSLIRGGHNTYEVTVAVEKVYAPRRPINILVALNQDTLDLHKRELSESAVVLYNTDNAEVNTGDFPESVVTVGIPFEQLAEQSGAPKVARNVVALGATFGLLDLSFDRLKEIIELNFQLKRKDDSIINANLKSGQAGLNYIKNNFKGEKIYKVEPKQSADKIILAGNGGIVWGAIKAGLKFFSAYPMTPASSILHVLAAQAKKYNIIVQHTEDEISAINAAIGASYTGVRAMTATSGGGFALMTEAWGMAGMAEVPLVAVEAMRVGPSSGMPTWTGQGDLKFLLSASHGEFPRFVLAPGNAEQCFELIQDAFNLAEKYQTPVMLITDKYLAASHESVSQSELKVKSIERGAVCTEQEVVKQKEYLRYKYTDSGVSPRVLPGTKGGEHTANSDEHNEKGFSEEGAEERTKMMDKRFRKEQTAKIEAPEPVLEGDKKAEITLISWGSTRGPIIEAMSELKKQGSKINFLQIKFISPFPAQKVREVFKKAKKVAVVENNKTGQLAGWIREQTGLIPDFKILKYDGRPFFIQELVQTIKELK